MNDIAPQGPSRLQTALRAASPAVWDWDFHHRLLLISDGFRSLYGIGPTAPFGIDEFLDSAHQDDRSLWHDILQGKSPPPGNLVYRLRQDNGSGPRWILANLQLSQSPAGDIIGLTAILEDVTAQRMAAYALMESEERLRIAIEAGRMAVWEVDLASGRVTNSPELNRLLGFPLDAEPTLADVRALYAPGEFERLREEGVTYERVRERASGGAAAVRRDFRAASVKDRTDVQAEFSLISPDGTRKQLILRAQHAPAIDGIGQRLTGLLIDITDRKRAEERLAMVARELQHRVKNSLAVAQALAVQTFRNSADVASALATFKGRLGALSAATDALLESGHDAVDLRQVIERIVHPYQATDKARFRIDGPAVQLSGKVASAIGMALHELCTNAVKYGALSVAEGSVTIEWLETEALDLTWTELGGPAVTPPLKRGFGSKLLETIIPEGSVVLDYRREGLVCRIHIGGIGMNENGDGNERDGHL